MGSGAGRLPSVETGAPIPAAGVAATTAGATGGCPVGCTVNEVGAAGTACSAKGAEIVVLALARPIFPASLGISSEPPDDVCAPGGIDAVSLATPACGELRAIDGGPEAAVLDPDDIPARLAEESDAAAAPPSPFFAACRYFCK